MKISVTSHYERQVLPYTPAQIYALVLDIEKYPQFLPWCVGARITERGDGYLLADMLIGYKMLREKFTSRVYFTPHEEIRVEYLNGPLKQLHNDWRFGPVEGSPLHCALEFTLDFEFQSGLLQRLAETFFQEALRRMVGAFEKRAQQLYG